MSEVRIIERPDEEDSESFRDNFLNRAAVVVHLSEPLRMRLRQDKIWKDKDGREHPVEKISPRYARNILGWLERRANFLYSGTHMQYLFFDESMMGDMAWDSFTAEHNALLEMTANEWLEGQPLVRALRARATS